MAVNYIVYKHTCPNGKVYIGITSQAPQTRWANGRGYTSVLFKHAIQKYGWENIKNEILYEGLTREQAEQKEIELIALYKSNQREYGYNLAKGGRTNSGYSMSDEWKGKISNAHKGKKFTEDHKKKLSLAKKGKTHKPISADAKRQIALSQNKRKEVEQYSLTGALVTRYISIKEAAKQLGVAYQGISNCCNGKRKTAFGFVWKYAEVG
jgi:group I intron endonuclease